MKRFTSSTPILLSVEQTAGTEKFSKVFGDRLSELSRCEKYQLAAVIALILWEIAEDAESSVMGPQVVAVEAIEKLEVSPSVKLCVLILKDEFPETLAAILPAISAYAKEDDRFISE
jgi:hypothetical protein